MKIRHIYISKAHNFIGHYGKPAGTNPVEEVDEVQCVAGQGLVGDRYFGHKDNYKGQVTFFDQAVFDALRETVNQPELAPSAMRRNIIVEGQDLNALIGQEFEIDGVRFEGSEECAPCFWMNEAVGEGAEACLKGRGGLRARILSDGVLRVAG